MRVFSGCNASNNDSIIKVNENKDFFKGSAIKKNISKLNGYVLYINLLFASCCRQVDFPANVLPSAQALIGNAGN